MPMWNNPFKILQRIGGHRLAWLGAPIFLYAWTVGGPFLLDDLHLLLKAERYQRGERKELALFEWVPSEAAFRELIDRGTLPWWAPPGLRIAFFRPVPEWSFYADVLLFNRHAVGHRLVSLAWFVVALLCLHRLFLTITSDPSRAGTATLLYGISQTISEPVAFICNRADLFVVIGTTLAASAYWSAGSRPMWKTLLLTAFGYGLALLSKEVGIALVGVLVVHEALARWRRWQPENARLRTYSVGLAFAMAICYLAYHAATKPAGAALAKGSTLLLHAITFPKTLGLYLAVWTTGFPISALLVATSIVSVVLVTVLGVVMGWVTFRYLRRGATLENGSTFFILWAVMFIAPALFTIAEQRALSLASVGWAFLLTTLLIPSEGTTVRAPMWLRHWLLAANGVISICAVVVSLLLRVYMENQMRDNLREYLAALRTPMNDGDALIIGEAKFDFEVPFAGDRLEYITGMKNLSIAFLTVSEANAEVERLDDHTLALKSTSPKLFNSKLHQVAWGPFRHFKVGEKYRGRDFMIEVATVKDNAVQELKVRFDQSLTSPRLHFYPPKLDAIVRGLPTSRSMPSPTTSRNAR